MEEKDIPVISGPADSTKIDLPAAKTPPPVPALRRAPSTEIRRPAAPAPAPAPAQDPRSASEARKAAAVAPHPPAAAPAEEEDPEKLLREYAERQKTKVLRLEQQLQEQKRVLAERDALKAKAEALSKELQEARKQIDASAKQEEILKDLQGKLDASLLSHTISTEEISKLKTKVADYSEALKKSEAGRSHFEKLHQEGQKALAAQAEARKEAESRIQAALQALQHAPASDPAATRPTGAAKPAVPSPARPAPIVVRK
jgi:hypothetical protein